LEIDGSNATDSLSEVSQCHDCLMVLGQVNNGEVTTTASHREKTALLVGLGNGMGDDEGLWTQGEMGNKAPQRHLEVQD